MIYQWKSKFEKWALDVAAALASDNKEQIGAVLAELRSDQDDPGLPTPVDRLSRLIVEGFNDSMTADGFRIALFNALDSTDARLNALELIDDFLGEADSWLEPLEVARLLSARGVLRGRVAFCDDSGPTSQKFSQGLDDFDRSLVLSGKAEGAIFRHTSWLLGALLVEGERYREASEALRNALRGPLETATDGLYFAIATRLFRPELASFVADTLEGAAGDLALAKAQTPICRWSSNPESGDIRAEGDGGKHYTSGSFDAYWAPTALTRMALSAMLGLTANLSEGERKGHRFEACWLRKRWGAVLSNFSPYTRSGKEDNQAALLEAITDLER